MTTSTDQVARCTCGHPEDQHGKVGRRRPCLGRRRRPRGRYSKYGTIPCDCGDFAESKRRVA